MLRNIKHRYQRITYVKESRVSSCSSEVVTVLAWTEQIKCRGLSEQPIHIRVVTKSYNIKLHMGITWINVNHISPALERSVINNWGGGGGGGGLNRFYLRLTSPSSSCSTTFS